MIKCKKGNVRFKGDVGEIEAELICTIMEFMKTQFEMREEKEIEAFRETALGLINSKNEKELFHFGMKNATKRLMENISEHLGFVEFILDDEDKETEEVEAEEVEDDKD